MEPVPEPRSADDGERSVRVVLVEDHDALREQLHLLLVNAGIDVVGATASLEEGHRTVRALAPDVVVLDTKLPDGFGVDLCQVLVQEMPGLLVLIHSATISSDQLDQALAAGADAVIPKSIRADALLTAIRTLGGV